MSKKHSPGHQVQRRRLNCARKIKHPSYASAGTSLITAVGDNAGDMFAVYLCDFCGFYHWGHTNPQLRIAKALGL